MEQILNVLGFTDAVSIFWHCLAYTAMILIIIAVLSEKYRNQFFLCGSLILLFYSWLYLHNPILACLQLVVMMSGVLTILHIQKSAFFVVGLAIIVFIALLATGQIFGLWPWLGALGLFAVALGLARLPCKQGFALMALGAFLVTIYSLALSIWVFFALSIIFFTANIIELRKK